MNNNEEKNNNLPEETPAEQAVRLEKEQAEKAAQAVEENAEDVGKTEKKKTSSQDKKEKGKLSLKSFNTKKLKYGSVATLITVIVVAAAILLNVVVGLVGDRVNLKLDFTSTGMYDISQDTIDYLKTLNQNVEIVTMTDEATLESSTSVYYKQIYETIKKYAYYSDKIDVKFVNMTADPTYVNKYSQVYKGTISQDSIVIACGNKVKVTTINGLFNAEPNYQTYQYEIKSSKAEQVITSAIMYVTDPAPKQAAILDIETQGIGNSMLQALLENDGFDVTVVDPLTSDFPSDADLIVVNAPLNDFPEDLVDKLYNFLENGGTYGKNLIYLANAAQKDTPNIDAFLAEWGIEVSKGVIGDLDTNNLASNSTYYAIKNYITDNDYSKNVAQKDLPVVSYFARPVKLLFESSGSVTTVPLLSTADTAYVLTQEMQDSYNESGVEPSDADIKSLQGVYNTIALANKYAFDSDNNRRDSNVLVYGSSNMLDENITGAAYYNNGDYFVSAVNKMVGKDAGITIVAKDFSAATFETSASSYRSSFVVFIFIIPLAALIIGIVVWLRRRHK